MAWFIQDNLAIGGGVSVSFYTSKATAAIPAPPLPQKASTISHPFISDRLPAIILVAAGGYAFAQLNIQYGISGGKSESKTSTGASSETTTKPKGDWNAGLSLLRTFHHFQWAFGSIGFNYGKSKTMYEYRPSTGTGYDYNQWIQQVLYPGECGVAGAYLGRQ